ncbi:hypothetical protein QFZ82_005775 [Streptomyces sp. V4I23]|nr:hypothetical protein [Streptomyces sp. V4I23]
MAYRAIQAPLGGLLTAARSWEESEARGSGQSPNGRAAQGD